MPPSPLTVTLIQSTILNAISNILAQLIDRHKENLTNRTHGGKKKPFALNTIALIQFITYGAIIVPPNFSWQRYIEARFPGFPSWKRNNDNHVPEPNGLLPTKEKPFRPKQQRSGMWNFAVKFLLDQTIAGVCNILLFIVLINLLKGSNLGRVWELVCEDFGPIMLARLKFRPIVSALMYTVVPVDRRVVFGSACGVIWGIYLSLYAVV
ncbi:unnamed protein product [Aspergillus oryzae RIB40]|uniref:DNA, SC113 n=2 Tax=Aspergillus oryzae TaxID=5062 RepID=Q2U6T2_ASPOR|nr:unnamed protein product [Aspergillus oryzae RIB40]XP_041147984.1 uncharacterized protein G4B84_008412 [Aspergillus flavus NRRL3357]EIT82553.1 hypothetical protein Ao3042_00339 [Aspergillus oryzae 3.042]KDE75259.1 hypothetical protein AO1008_11584 [Aspergillus oryzae 100-8]QMW45014.1 hypothetical protein G4B11_008434 [Aspergillus flavus]QMW32981.1 hypothetical protein G4B84_008412 [Aspergillus flavus NRRL3357]BAE62733.1 unnamed protein product [Aspergillus oryzae RIB40]|eukprot:EIT82553.1 hypothetical protein Ao3042_00339 [Aspergillus oryzae 3.042]